MSRFNPDSLVKIGKAKVLFEGQKVYWQKSPADIGKIGMIDIVHNTMDIYWEQEQHAIRYLIKEPELYAPVHRIYVEEIEDEYQWTSAFHVENRGFESHWGHQQRRNTCLSNLEQK